MTLPVALTGTDVIGQAKTGTGKTLGFGLPLLERVTVPADVEAGRAQPEDLTDTPQALIVVPTRELCVQVTNDLLTAGKVRNVRVTAIYGGRAYEPQVEALKKGVDVVVGTPGRLLDLAGQKKLNLKHVKCLVLDEADEMLDLGFLPDVEKIIAMLPARRQTMLFSATMPGAVIGLARRYMSQPTHIRATAPDDEGATVANIKQFVFRAHSLDKPEMVSRILQADGRGLAMIFCRTKRTAADIAEQLQRRGFASGSVHGDLGQGAREQALRAFRNGKVDVLVCTDVAARGIDVEGVTHVVNYQSPEDEKTYLHRIGRTGRAGAKGTAITLVDWDDIPRWQLINKALELDFNDPVETYSTSPHLFAELGIPEGTKGVLPRSERTRAGLEAEELEDLGETGGRGARGRGGRGGRNEGRPADREHSADRERPARTPRRRRRTRGGAPLDSAAVTPAAGTPADAAPVEGTVADEASGTRTPRRRRRLRGGSPAQTVTTGESTAPSEPLETVEPAESAVATAEGPALDAAEAPAKPRRRRTRKSAEQAVTTAPAETGTEVAPEPAAPAETTAETALDTAEPTADQPEAKPRRRTRKAATATEAAADTAEGVVDEAETKPRRRTRKATATAPEAAPDAAEGVVDEAETKPRRRTRKATAATVTADAAEAAVDTAEAKPRRTRKAAAAVAAEIPAQVADGPDSAAEAAVDAAEGAEAKPRRRTRKAATAPEAVADTTGEAETKPRRRTRKTAETADAPVADEATAAKPRRTRKAAATADAPEAAEAKPRRTRKSVAATAVADEAEVKPRRRTRKAAEAPAEAVDAVAEPKPRRTRKTAAAKAAVDTAEIPAQTTAKAATTAEPTDA
ncbi:DEAD/DEAH box helicase [Streptomyces sp. NPDC088337]|uniref:DEAD/DEAH box helicase n=1 Tax=unclassified Streptomyces TaxID=2593676 RepID=UPI002DDAE9DA|nr:DEAD/DEAH box helicase [Streptomyces sp. NBC_01788]WSB28601.1 DEAD/DEAH box helicase [Streptomyces sp. NBC_01788]